MSRKNNFPNPLLNAEFEELWKKADLDAVQESEPTTPRLGMRWYKPSADEFKIWNGATWNIH